MRDDYAIVIGLSSYPVLGDPPAHLNGPENDANAIVEWLTRAKPSGGGLDSSRIRLIRSSDSKSPPEAAPTRDELEKAFLWLDGLAKANQEKGHGRAVGKRLYLYVAGHGFSPNVNQACLLTGNATEEAVTANVFPTGWLQWLQDAQYFRELVLWVDCCMDRKVLASPTPPPLSPIGAGGAGGPRFVAFAAPRPLKAVEKPIPQDDHRWHGVFTWNLLLGLTGAAADATGRVTGRSLANWLCQAQLDWLDPAERISPEVAKTPEIVTQSEGLVFARGLLPAELEVTLRFPSAAEGQKARLWSGAPPQPGEWFTIAAGGHRLRLTPGLYLAEVAEARLRHGFSVSRQGAEISISEPGLPPALGSGPFSLSLDPDEPTAAIRLVDSSFVSIETAEGMLHTDLPRGLYQFRILIGRQVIEKVILLDANWDNKTETLPPVPEIATPIPLPGTRTTREYHRSVVSDPRVDVKLGSGAELLLVARSYSKDESAAGTAPWEDVAILDEAGDVIVDLAQSGRRGTGPDPIAACCIELLPGAYFLRYKLRDQSHVAQSIVLTPGNYRFEAYVLVPDKEHVRPTTSLLMRRRGIPWGSPDDIQFEKARVALADERSVLSEQLRELLLDRSDNPLSGILGGHLLLLERQLKGQTDWGLFSDVIRNLRLLLGNDHPDVEALSLKCPDPTLQRRAPILTAPLFEQSWRLLVEASQDHPELVPLDLWKRVHAPVAASPFFAWTLEHRSQDAFRQALGEAIFGREEDLDTGEADSSRRAADLGLPPAALELLYDEVAARVGR